MIASLSDIVISIILIGAKTQSFTTSRPSGQIKWQTPAHLTTIVDFVTGIIDTKPKYIVNWYT